MFAGHDLPEIRLMLFIEPQDIGRSDGMPGWGSKLEDDGDLDAARYWYERSAQSPSGYGSLFLGTFLRNHRDLEGARDWFRKAVWSAPGWVEALIPGRVMGYGTPEEVLR